MGKALEGLIRGGLTGVRARVPSQCRIENVPSRLFAKIGEASHLGGGRIQMVQPRKFPKTKKAKHGTTCQIG